MRSSLSTWPDFFSSKERRLNSKSPPKLTEGEETALSDAMREPGPRVGESFYNGPLDEGIPYVFFILSEPHEPSDVLQVSAIVQVKRFGQDSPQSATRPRHSPRDQAFQI